MSTTVGGVVKNRYAKLELERIALIYVLEFEMSMIACNVKHIVKKIVAVTMNE